MSALAVNPVLLAGTLAVVFGAAWSWWDSRTPASRRDRYADFLADLEADMEARRN